jgi:hypothetical protein
MAELPQASTQWCKHEDSTYAYLRNVGNTTTPETGSVLVQNRRDWYTVRLYDTVLGFCEHGDELSGPMRNGIP